MGSLMPGGSDLMDILGVCLGIDVHAASYYLQTVYTHFDALRNKGKEFMVLNSPPNNQNKHSWDLVNDQVHSNNIDVM